MSGQFVISLDFELLWGVRDHADRQAYGQNVLGARDAVPRMLERFAARGIRATWATVGFLFCKTKDELIASLPFNQTGRISRAIVAVAGKSFRLADYFSGLLTVQSLYQYST